MSILSNRCGRFSQPPTAWVSPDRSPTAFGCGAGRPGGWWPEMTILWKRKKTDFKHALGRDVLKVCQEIVGCFDVYIYIRYIVSTYRKDFKKKHSSRKSHHDLCKMNKWAPRFFGDRKVGKGRLLFLTSYDRHYRIILKGSYHQTVDKLSERMYSQANNKILDEAIAYAILCNDMMPIDSWMSDLGAYHWGNRLWNWSPQLKRGLEIEIVFDIHWSLFSRMIIAWWSDLIFDI